ncbi:MAG TPA: extracellular solute-binding protein [Candidatus Binatia bacterium]|nr:extracellular solute-binding protein [Candidatus Binatia bacterium]
MAHFIIGRKPQSEALFVKGRAFLKTRLAAIVILIVTAVPICGRADWRDDWNEALNAAKKEGKVAVITDVTAAIRDALMIPFQEKYGITVDLFGALGREVPPRIAAERKAGRYLWDVFVHGTTTGLESMIPMGAFDPLDPALILPDVKDPKFWRGGMEFLDPNKMLLTMTPFQRGTIFYNPKLVNPKEFKSHKDLLDPKWKGKLILDDPRRAGPGQATFTFFYLHPELGPDFIRALGKQQITIMKDFAQEVDAIGQGRYPVLIGTADFVAIARAKQGVPVAIIDPRQLKEGTDVSPANGALALFNKAPHSNAAKIYINWLLSKEGQTGFARASGYVSARADVPTDHTEPWRVPQPGAIKTYTKAAMQAKDKLMPLLNEVFGNP